LRNGRPTSPLATPAATKVERTVQWERVASARMAQAFPDFVAEGRRKRKREKRLR
jgi:hypothetical protein